MDQNQQAPLKETAQRFVRSVVLFAGSDVGRKAKFLFGALFALLCGLSGLNIANNYVGRNFMTAIAQRQSAEFVRQAILYLGVFVVLTVAGAFARFAEERLALLWREFLTNRAVNLYLEDGTYYQLSTSGQLSYPDQRIADDIREFTITTLSFVIMLFSSSLTVVSFSILLWSISPLLFGAAALYAAAGSYFTIVLGRPLITLNYDRLDREASFRSSLIHLRENAESIFFARGEKFQKARLAHRIDEVVANLSRIIAINRNLGFFTGGYNWVIQIVPYLIIAPVFIRGDIEFGVVTQSGAAFAMLVGAFSLIVRQFESISNFAAVVSRLTSLQDAIEKSHRTEAAIAIVEQDGPLTFEKLSLAAPEGGAMLLNDLSVSIPAGMRVLVTGHTHAPSSALFRATAGIPTAGTGRIIRPPDILFLPQRPYLPVGTLREIVVRPDRQGQVSDAQITPILHELGLDKTTSSFGGLDTQAERQNVLSLADQQMVAVAGAVLSAPRIVLLDWLELTLDADQLKRVVLLFTRHSITVVSFGKAAEGRDLYQAILAYGDDGNWTWTVSTPPGSSP